MGRVSCFFVAFCFWAGAVGTATAADSSPPLDALIEQFDAVALGHEHGSRPAIIRKWSSGPGLAFFTQADFDVRPYFGQIVDQLREISRLSGLSIHLSRDAGDANLQLGFFPREDFAKLRGDPEDSEYRRFVRTSACIAISRLDDRSAGKIIGGAIIIGTDIDDTLRRHCLIEELVQVMGLPNDACYYRPSLFCERDHVKSLTKPDIILLQTLYDSRLRPGMEREEALPIARRIMSEIYDGRHSEEPETSAH